MTPYSVYRLADGVLTGAIVRGPRHSVFLNTPPECGLVAGEWDPAQFRVVEGAAVPHVTESPARSDDAQWRDVRSTRDALLRACDWVVTRASERGEPVPADWQAYRQALRDITTQPLPVKWPARPE